jgi:hypothetical protein
VKKVLEDGSGFVSVQEGNGGRALIDLATFKAE